MPEPVNVVKLRTHTDTLYDLLTAYATERVRRLGGKAYRPPPVPVLLIEEAREQKKSLRAHWAHLVVHGSLHLIGYDHERDSDADRMERREIAVLRRLGFPNPYRSA